MCEFRLPPCIGSPFRSLRIEIQQPDYYLGKKKNLLPLQRKTQVAHVPCQISSIALVRGCLFLLCFGRTVPRLLSTTRLKTAAPA